MHCLVTGGAGFLGSVLVGSLRSMGVNVDVLSRRGGSDILCADLVQGPPDLPPVGYDVVYHAAGKAHVVPRSVDERGEFFSVNVEGTRHLLTSLDRQARRPAALVLVSTVAVYGLEAGDLLNETTALQATDPYGLSKAQAEDLVQEWGDRSGVRISIVRLPLVAGPNVPGNLGAMVAAMRRGRYLGVGDGTARRSVVNASDVARALPAVASAGGIFHLTDGQHPTFAQIEAAIAEALDRPIPHRIPIGVARIIAGAGDLIERATNRRVPLTRRGLTKMTSSLTFDDSRARTRLGWDPTPVLDVAPEWCGGPTGSPAGRRGA